MILDRLIGWFSPAAGARRQRHRLLGEALRGRQYEAARRDRTTDHWLFEDGSPVEACAQAERLRAIARNMVANNAWARRAVQVLVAEVIGDGIVPEPLGRSPEDAKRIKGLWSAWARRADLAGKTTFEGLQSLAFRSIVEAGETVIRRVMVADGDPPLRLQVLEPDHLAWDRTDERIVHGVERSASGEVEAYWLYPRHPGGTTGTMVLQSPLRVPAEDVVHAFAVERAGQPRGVTWLAPVIIALRDLHELERAELVKAKVEACLAGAVERPDSGLAPLGQVEEGREGELLETFRPGMVAYLRPGETVKFLDPSKKSEFGPFVLHVLLKIAGGLGLTYDQLTGDLRQANYSSLRAGKIVFRRLVTQWQHQLVVPQICDPVWRWFVDAEIAAGRLPEGEYPVEWVAPGHEPIDPLKDAEAEIALIRAGLKPLSRAASERGESIETLLEEYVRINRTLDAGGLVFDSDPRRGANGTARAKETVDVG